MTATYITTTLPYVNARPHVGHALELVQADVLARYHRGRGDAVRFQAGTDDNSLKNVLAAAAAGAGVREFVDRNAEAFGALGGALSLSVDDFIRTSRDPRHRPASRHSGGPAPLTCTGSGTRASTASAVSSSIRRANCGGASAPSTRPSRSRSARRTGSSGCPGTPRRCGKRSLPDGC
jgi:tRNA synthetases class I (M)